MNIDLIAKASAGNVQC